jgi:hypothetical protein
MDGARCTPLSEAHFTLECRHIAVLLEVGVLTRSIARMETDVVLAFNYLVMCAAVSIWKGFPCAVCHWTLIQKRVYMVDEMHTKCCLPGLPGTGLNCRVTIPFEQKVVRTVHRMFRDQTFTTDVFAMAAMEDTLITRKPSPETVRRAKKRLNGWKTQLLNNYFPVAVWRNETGKELSALEKLLITPEGLMYLGLDKMPDTNALLETISNGVMCIDNASMCRGCFKSSPSTGRGRKRRGRKKAPIPCSECKRMYFCCEDCLLSGSMGRHKSLECPMIRGDWVDVVE